MKPTLLVLALVVLGLATPALAVIIDDDPNAAYCGEHYPCPEVPKCPEPSPAFLYFLGGVVAGVCVGLGISALSKRTP